MIVCSGCKFRGILFLVKLRFLINHSLLNHGSRRMFDYMMYKIEMGSETNSVKFLTEILA